jgi:crotonyl-CoA carboxylase/reductase
MEIVPIGKLPELGTVPQMMFAQTLRNTRFGEPIHAIQPETVPVPEINDDEVLIAVMAAGLNYNSVWAALAYPVDMMQLAQQRKESDLPYYILGSDCAGIVYKKGKNVRNVNIGDEVVIQGGWYDEQDAYVLAGGDPTISKSFRAWGYETNFGSYAQFCKVKHFQCLPKPKHISWAAAAVYMVSGVTAYRMLHHYAPHQIKNNDVVLIWGGSGGLGSMAIQLVKAAGGIPVAVVSSENKKHFCEQLGALVLNRSQYQHWGELSPADVLPENQDIWRNAVKPFYKDLLQLTNGRLPRIVIEHPGASTFPTSLYVCDKDGMVITCAGTTGYAGTFDLRYLWLYNKRIQGSHYANLQECITLNNLVINNVIHPILGAEYTFDFLPNALQMMHENKHPMGSIAIKIGYQ